VLNASRHHRKNRYLDELDRHDARRCSTPRGITGKIAFPAIASKKKITSAQRLAASPEKSRDAAPAQYHSRRGAQRLAASPEKSRSITSRSYPNPQGCSTPRGITGKIAQQKWLGIQPRRLCSTPRGITGKIAHW